jgi:hypothetical protein
MVVSSASMKKATATSHGNSRLLAGLGTGASMEVGWLMSWGEVNGFVAIGPS